MTTSKETMISDTTARKSRGYTTSTALLEALQGAGVEYIFANFGSDHPGIIEALAESRATGGSPPAVLTCPHEMVGMSAAHGFAAVSGRPQAVMVHVECGTQSLGGAIHNAAKARVPIFIFAGASPFTQEGELTGSRNEFIQWIQDVHDQRGIVRGYMRYDNEIRTGANVKQLVARAMQFATSDPKGPVYLVGAREVMEAETLATELDFGRWRALAPAALPGAGLTAIAAALSQATLPLIVTSFVGRNPRAVEELLLLCGAHGIGVLESVPNYVNFPHTDPLYQGNQWNEPTQNEALAQADVVLVIDSDVPWIPTVSRPAAHARIFHIDIDPLKTQMPLWHIDAEQQFASDAFTALHQLNAKLEDFKTDPDRIKDRRARWNVLHQTRRQSLARKEISGGGLTPELLTVAIKRRLDDNSLLIVEGISNYQTIFDHLAMDKPGSLFTSGGGSLGWHGGAAIGAKLAAPTKTVIALAGDGSYMFSVPSSVHWMARRYQTPFLTVIYNNGGWKSPKLSALAVHPDGYARDAADLDLSFAPQADYGAIAAAAGGAHATIVTGLAELDRALDQALNIVQNEKRCAVIDVHLPRL